MIKPATLWGLFKTCDDSAWLGDICRALGGQQVELDYGQARMLDAIRQDSEWMTERIEAKREKWRLQKRGQRGTFGPVESTDNEQCPPMSTDVHRCPQDIEDSQMSAAHPSIHPSVHPSIRPNRISPPTRACAREISDEDLAQAAHALGIPADYLQTFRETMAIKAWAYTSPNGKLVRVTRNNLATVLGSFYRQDQKDKTNAKNQSGNTGRAGRSADNYLAGQPRQGGEF